MLYPSKIMIFCLFSIISMVLMPSCQKTQEHPVPNIPIYISPIYIYDPEFTSLLDNYGSHVIANEGYMNNGILLIHLGNSEYKAYDCTCTHEIKAGCKALPYKSQINSAVCNCCGSIYELSFGTPTSGPANYLLKEYKVAFDGAYIRIYNQ